jgi:hypothetical protein
MGISRVYREGKGEEQHTDSHMNIAVNVTPMCYSSTNTRFIQQLSTPYGTTK